MMLRAVPHLNCTLAMVALFHRLTADALASAITALPFVPFDSAIVFVAHFFPHSEITSATPHIRAAVCR